MCGIAGYWSADPRAPEVLPRMTAALAHRGPDADGFYYDGAVGLGHRRLSIIDIEGSSQPLVSADGSIVAIFNGEIYNFRELRRSLTAAGHQFTTKGDGEVLLHAWRARGERMLEWLTGMFAFALWDRTRQQLFVARDHLGVKPLYYAWHAGSLVFGSEIKALLPFPGLPLAVDRDALALYLECQYIPAPYSIYSGIRKLEAGHWLSVRDGSLRTGSFWTPSYVPKHEVDAATAVDMLDERLKRSVESMLVSDVPVGVFVSGGVDSGLVAAMANQLSGGAIDTFNLGFTGHEVGSEHEHAQRVAAHIGSRHHCLMLAPGDVLAGMDRWVETFDEPFGDHAALPTMALAKFARETVKVVLTGEGADEVFGGYANYAKRVREERITTVLGARGSPLPLLLRRLPGRLTRDRILKAVLEPARRRYTTIPNVFDSALRRTYLTDAFRLSTQTTLADRAELFFTECDSPSYLDRLLNIDTRLWLPDDLLAKVDRATMAFSLEARVPYLDQDLVDWCARLDPALKVGNDGETKVLLKRLAERYLPRQTVYRSKQGFIMPLDRWMANELKPEISSALGPEGLQRRGLMKLPALRNLCSEHFAGKKNHATRLWTLLVLERWLARYQPDFVV
jgi:asparagine synthase (glutamine-hydrolysing)